MTSGREKAHGRGAHGLGFRVQVVGFWLSGFGFRVSGRTADEEDFLGGIHQPEAPLLQGSGFRVWGLGFGV